MDNGHESLRLFHKTLGLFAYYKQVSIFPNGELHVKVLKPHKKGKWSNTIPNSSTTRTPSILSNKPCGTCLFQTPRSPLKPRAPSPPLSYNIYSFM